MSISILLALFFYPKFQRQFFIIAVFSSPPHRIYDFKVETEVSIVLISILFIFLKFYHRFFFNSSRKKNSNRKNLTVQPYAFENASLK